MMKRKRFLTILLCLCAVLSECTKEKEVSATAADIDSSSATISDDNLAWQESIPFGSDNLDEFHAVIDEIPYDGGYIGSFSDSEGYIVLTAAPAMNWQMIRIYLTEDGGETWKEIGNPCSQHISVLTGAAFSSPEIGFICYRYYQDAGPDIWWTSDGGNSWSELTVNLPAEYKNADGSLKPEYRFTPETPEFHDGKGIFPITALNVDAEIKTTLYMYSSDNGMSWHF